MYLKYGNYRHEDNEVELASITKHLVRAESGAKRLLRETWTLKGELRAATQSALDAAIRQLENAYLRQDGRDAVFYFDDGTATQHQLRNSRSLSGVRVLSLSYPVGRGAEFATYRTYEIQLEADFPVADNTANLLAWQESITFQGSGGPDVSVTEVLDGPPLIELSGTHTPCYATQSGSALGHRSYPSVPGPIWPANEIGRERSITPGTPKLLNGVLVEWPVSWSYRFVAQGPLSGLPHQPPNS